MKQLKSVLIISSLVFGLGSCFVLAEPIAKNYPLVPITEFKNSSHDKFNVRGYIVGVVECPKGSMCITIDGIQISASKIAPDIDAETREKLRADGELIFLGSDHPKRFNFEEGRRYIISYKTGKGIVGATIEN